MDMSSNQNTVSQIYDQLKPELRDQLETFASFLLRNQNTQTKQKPKFNWVGALKGYDAPKTSVEIQHEISKTRIKDE